jgi:hypothetical protein
MMRRKRQWSCAYIHTYVHTYNAGIESAEQKSWRCLPFGFVRVTIHFLHVYVLKCIIKTAWIIIHVTLRSYVPRRLEVSYVHVLF